MLSYLFDEFDIDIIKHVLILNYQIPLPTRYPQQGRAKKMAKRGRGRPPGSKNKPKVPTPSRTNALRQRRQIVIQDEGSDSDDLQITVPVGDVEEERNGTENGRAEDENDVDEVGAAQLALANRPPASKLHQTLKSTFILTANELAKNYDEKPTELNLLAILALPKLGIAPTHEKKHTAKSRKLMEQIRKGETLQLLRLPLPERQVRAARRAAEMEPEEAALSWIEQKRLQQMMSKGMFKKAANVVRGATSISQLTEEILEELRSKHPAGTPNPFGKVKGRASPGLKNEDLLAECIEKLDRQTAAGLSGWTPELLKVAYGRREDARGKNFRAFMWTLAKSISRGTAPGHRLLCGSRLTPLDKPDGPGIRPITCGELFFRVSVRYVLQEWGVKEEYLLPEQFGVGTGVEPICEYIQQILDGLQPDDTTTVYSLDSKNAFNTMARKAIADSTKKSAPDFFRLARWTYNTPAPLVVGVGEDQHVLYSTEGVRQGDPMAAFLFSLGLRPVLQALRDKIRNKDETAVVIAYLDDIYVISKETDLLPTIEDFFAAPDRKEGIQLNVSKTRVDKLSSVKYGNQAFPILGTVKGSKEVRKEFIQARTAELRRQLRRLERVPKQEALALLRLCFSAQNRHLLRSMDTSDLEEELGALDEVLYSFLDKLRGAPEGPRPETVTRIYSFMSKFGGLGVLSHVETREHAYLASIGTSREILKRSRLNSDNTVQELGEQQAHAGVPEERNFYRLLEPAMPTVAEEQQRVVSQKARTLADMQNKYDEFLEALPPDIRLAFVDMTSRIGMAWFHAMSTNGKYRHLTDSQITNALAIHTLTTQISPGVCENCGELDSETHFEACPNTSKQLIWNRRHNYVRDSMVAALSKDKKKQVRKEPHINHHNNQRGDIRVEVAAGEHEDNAYFGFVDITVKAVLGVHTEQARAKARAESEQQDHGKLKSTRAEIEAALQLGADAKRYTYREAIAQGARFQPLVISSGGTLHKEFYKYMKAMIPDPQVRSNLCTDVSIALVRARAELLSARAR